MKPTQRRQRTLTTTSNEWIGFILADVMISIKFNDVTYLKYEFAN